MTRTRLLPALTLACGLGVGTLFGSTLVSHASAAVLAACGVPTHHAAPVVKPKPAQPAVRILTKLTGSDNQQTDTFTASGPFAVVWHTSLQDASVGSGFFGVELDDASGTMLDVVANSAKAGDGHTIEHADCSHGCYFKVTAANVDYTMVAGQ